MNDDRPRVSLVGVTAAPATFAQRAWAGAALVLTLGALAAAVVAVIAHFPLAVAVVACYGGAAWATWWGIRRTPPARYVGLGAAAVLVAGSVALAIAADALFEDLIIVAALI